MLQLHDIFVVAFRSADASSFRILNDEEFVRMVTTGTAADYAVVDVDVSDEFNGYHSFYTAFYNSRLRDSVQDVWGDVDRFMTRTVDAWLNVVWSHPDELWDESNSIFFVPASVLSMGVLQATFNVDVPPSFSVLNYKPAQQAMGTTPAAANTSNAQPTKAAWLL